jgi:hypothetical protein
MGELIHRLNATEVGYLYLAGTVMLRPVLVDSGGGANTSSLTYQPTSSS